METAIQVIWWIGLIGALLATLVILKEVALVLRTLRDIHRLAVFTREAARGVASNTAVISSLDLLDGPINRLHESTRSTATAAALIETRLGALTGDRPAPGDGD